MTPALVAVAVTVALTVGSQILQKRLALQRLAENPRSMLRWYLRRQLFWAAGLCHALAMAFWFYALTLMEVSKAYALLSINYLLVPLAARWWLHETFSARQWLGALVLVAGLVLVGHS